WAPVRMEQRRPIAGDLPRGSFVLEIAFPAPAASEPVGEQAAPAAASPASPPGDAGAPTQPPELFAVFVPDEDGVRIAWGADERYLISLLVQPAHARASATLAGRAGLGELNQHRILAGGFVSLAGLDELSSGSLE